MTSRPTAPSRASAPPATSRKRSATRTGPFSAPIPTPDATLVAKVVSHTQPDMSKLAEQRNAIRDDLKSQKAREMDGLFESGLRDALIRQGKIKIYPDVIKRMISSYTGA